MTFRSLLAFGVLGSFLACASVSAEPDTWAYFGCIGKQAPGIYVAPFDSETGTLGEARLLTETETIASSFLAIDPSGTRLYAVQKHAEGGGVGSYVINPSTGTLAAVNAVSIGSRGACHVCITPDGKTLATADYGEGKVASFSVGEDGSISEVVSLIQHEGSSVNERRQTGPHAHCVVPSPDGSLIVSADLGADKIFLYEVGAGGAIKPHLQPSVPTKPGGGPRHFAFHPTMPFAYTNLELTSEVTSFDFAGGRLMEKNSVSTLPEPVEGNSTSEMLIHPSGKYLYVANRGHNSIAAFAIGAHGDLSSIGHASCGGEIPRNFGIAPDGRHIVTCNQKSGNAGVVKVAQDGSLTVTDQTLPLPTPMCVRFVPMAK